MSEGHDGYYSALLRARWGLWQTTSSTHVFPPLENEANITSFSKSVTHTEKKQDPGIRESSVPYTHIAFTLAYYLYFKLYLKIGI